MNDNTFNVSGLLLENIKCFKNIDVDFHIENGDTARWITLIGENATGKSTLMQSIAILIAEVDNAGVLIPRPLNWLRDDNKFGVLMIRAESNTGNSLERRCLVVGNKHLKSESGVRDSFGYEKIYTEPGFVEQISKIYSASVDLWKTDPTKPEYDPNYLPRWDFNVGGYPGFPFAFAAAYGAFRRISRRDSLPSISPVKPERYTNFVSIFGDDEDLPLFEQWIWYLDNQAVKGNERSIRLLDIAINAINELLPDEVEFDKDLLNRNSEIGFLVQGVSVLASSLSDGYRSIIALGGDLIWRILNSYPESSNPLMESGVVLIDELDVHLHPRWQSWIAQKLQSVFPNVQFIVATHSPLVAMGAYWNQETGQRNESVLTLKLEMNDGEVYVRKISDDIATMDIGRLLESPAFGMVAPRPPEVEAKIDRYDELLGKLDRTPAEEEEFQQLRAFMAEARPIGGPPEPGSLEARMRAFLDKTLPQ